jgi:hypothetical protein
MLANDITKKEIEKIIIGRSTLVALAQTMLFLEMLKISIFSFLKEYFFVHENEESFEII